MRNESTTTAALRRGADVVDVCRCVGNAIRQPGGCFTCGKAYTAPKRPELPAVQPYTPPERLPTPERLPLHQRDVGEYLGSQV